MSASTNGSEWIGNHKEKEKVTVNIVEGESNHITKDANARDQ